MVKENSIMKEERYAVILIDYNAEGRIVQYPPILRTDDRNKAFELMGKVKKNENKEPYNEYDEVRILEDGEWVAIQELLDLRY